MTAVILAAGYGSRLRPLTSEMHKTMVPVAGERIIDRIVSALEAAAVIDAVVVLGYRAGEVREYLESRYGAAMRLTFVENPDFATADLDVVDLTRLARASEWVSVRQLLAKPFSLIKMDFGTIHRGVANTGDYDRILFWVSCIKRGALLPAEPLVHRIPDHCSGEDRER